MRRKSPVFKRYPSVLPATLCDPSSEYKARRLSPARSASSSRGVAAISRVFIHRFPAFCAHKGNRPDLRGHPSRDYANEPTQRGSTDCQPATLLPSGNHKPAAFSSSTKTRTTRSARLPCYLARTYVGGHHAGTPP